MFFSVPKEDMNRAGIYCMACYPTGDSYIGSTVNFYNRYWSHKSAAKSSNEDVYVKIREIGIENFTFSVVCFWGGRLVDLRFEERRIIHSLQPTLNTNAKAMRKDLPKKHQGSVTAYSYEEFRRVVAEANRTKGTEILAPVRSKKGKKAA